MNPLKISISKTEIFLFCIAFFYRLLIFLVVLWLSTQAGFDYPLQGSDARGYWKLASFITQGESFFATYNKGDELFRPPGYPTFLASLHAISGHTIPTQYIVVFVQMALAAYTVILLYRLLQPFISETAAQLAALFFALEPNSAYYSTVLLSDTLFVFLLVTTAYILLKRTSYGAYFLAGLFLGATMLVRPIAQFFPAIAALFIFYTQDVQRTTVVCVAAFLLGSLLLPLPWMIYTNTATGNFILSSSGANTYYKYVMPQFISWQTGQPHTEIRETFLTALDTAVAQGADSTHFMQSEVNRIVAENPISYGMYHVIKTIPFFLGDGIREILQKVQILDAKQPNISTLLLSGKVTEIMQIIYTNPYILIAAAGSIFWSAILLLGSMGFWYGIQQGFELRRLVIFFSAIIIYLTILTGPATSTRHRMPALPFLAGLAAIGVSAILKRKPDNTW